MRRRHVRQGFCACRIGRGAPRSVATMLRSRRRAGSLAVQSRAHDRRGRLPQGRFGKTSHAAGIAIARRRARHRRSSGGDRRREHREPDAWGSSTCPLVRPPFETCCQARRKPPAAAARARVDAGARLLPGGPPACRNIEDGHTRFAEYLRAAVHARGGRHDNRLARPDRRTGGSRRRHTGWSTPTCWSCPPRRRSRTSTACSTTWSSATVRPRSSRICTQDAPQSPSTPLTKRYMAAIAQRANRVVTSRRRRGRALRGHGGHPVERVSPAMRDAYRDLTEAIATARRQPT